MKYLLIILFAALSQTVLSQSKVYIRADTLQIYRDGGYAELKLMNRTKDSTGLLTNIGGGRTQFRKPRVLNDSTFTVGLDTLTLRGATGGGGLAATDSLTWINTVGFDSLLWTQSATVAAIKALAVSSTDASILTIGKPVLTNTDSTLHYSLTVNNDAPFFNAWKLQGIPISAGFPTANQYLGYNSITNLWEPKTIPPDSSAPGGIGGDLQLNDGFGGLGPAPIYSDGTSMRFGIVSYYDNDYSAFMTTDRHIPDIGKVNSLIAAAGGGADSSVFVTKTFLLNNRAINFSATADAIVFAGDSYITGQGASTGQPFSAQVAGYVGKTETNVGVGGTGARKAAYNINTTLAGRNNNYGISVMFGFNDYRRNGAATATLLKNKNAWYSILASAFLSDNSVTGNSASITKTGTWGTQDIGSPLGGKSTAMGGQAVYSQGGGNTAELTFTGPNVTIGTVAYSGTVFNGGSVKVEITDVAGSTLVDTIHTNFQTDGISDGFDANIQGLMAKVYWDLGNNSHTITITTLDANTFYLDYIGVLNGQSNAPPVMAWLIPKMKATSYALGGSDLDNGSAAAFDAGDSIIYEVTNPFKSRGYPVVVVPTNQTFDPENLANLDPDEVHLSNLGNDILAATGMSVIEPYSYSGIPVKNSQATIQITANDNILLGGNLAPDVTKTYFAAGYDLAGFPMMILNSPDAPAGSRSYDWYASKTGREIHYRFRNDDNTLASDYAVAYGTNHVTDSVYLGGVLRNDQFNFGGTLQGNPNKIFQVGTLPSSFARGFTFTNPSATANFRSTQFYTATDGSFNLRFVTDDFISGAADIFGITRPGSTTAGPGNWSTVLKYNADYSASMTTDRYIPDIGKVNALIAAASSGGITGVTTFGSTPNANGLSVSGSNILMQPADATNPGGVSTATQTFAGPKTLSGNATFTGTGTAILSVSGTSNVFQGSSFGIEVGSPSVPFLASNTSATAGVVLAGYYQRSGSYTAANNDGLELRFAVKNSAAASKDIALLHAVATNITAGTETGSFQVKLMSGGAAAALSYNFTPTLLTLNTGQLNIATQFTPANSTDATFGIKTMTIDDNFIYYRTSGGTWKKVAFVAF